jgi:GT2 family glycosyltransferase
MRAPARVPEDAATARPTVRGKFLFVGDEKLYLRGVTYGPFRPEADGCEYHTPKEVDRDFSLMAECGLNSVRVYTVPPRWLLDIAHRHGLWVMIGLPWEQHVTFLDDPKRCAQIERRVREMVSPCALHPALLCFVVGNEIPSTVARWHGRVPIERFLRRLYDAVKSVDPQCLVTYVNYPSTEYLDLPFCDFAAFNVYLEVEEKLDSYLARLQNVAGDRPLVIAEVGLDSSRNGVDRQAETLEWQLRTIFAGGCGGAFVFAWTDEWYRGGHDIDDWDFGLTTRDRQPKPALHAVRRAFAATPFESDRTWPLMSIVICTYNGSRTILDTMEGVRQLDYPRYEVIVVDDGSTDNVADLASRYACKLIRTPNRGLSNARNTGMLASSGQFIAYLDDDARPDPQWLTYLAHTFETSSHACVGGPNIAPAGDGFIADCVAHAPGGPVHVLLTDRIAEHVPGCNMAFRRQSLLEIGGFDPVFRAAGDDVDICWRIRQRGWTIGFSPAALVWHHRRNSARAYWKQQLGYGRAEALLERKWPAKYNPLGHPSWEGRVYTHGMLAAAGWRNWRIYHGTWGSALFQSVYHQAPNTLMTLPTTPDWFLVIVVLVIISGLSAAWPALMFAIPLAALAAALPIVQAIATGIRAIPREQDRVGADLWKRRAVVTGFCLVQPAARLLGRMRSGLNPWRFRRSGCRAIPRGRRWSLWSEQWHDANARLEKLESLLRLYDAVTVRGGDFDHWDLQVVGGVLGSAQLKLVVEEHGDGRQMVRIRAWPKCSRSGLIASLILLACGMVAAWFAAPAACGICVFSSTIIMLLAVEEASVAMGTIAKVVSPVSLSSGMPTGD